MIDISTYSVYFKEQQLLKNITLHIPKDAFFTIIGESGGGKTVLSQGILGLLPNGLRETGTITKKKLTIEIVVQNPLDSLQKNLSIQLQFHQLLKSKGIKQKQTRKRMIDEALNWVGFTDLPVVLKKKAYELSGGMCQKVALAMALSTKPQVLLVDEPTSALDEESREMILTLLDKIYHEKKIAIIFITHDLSIVTRYSTHIGVIKDGVLIEAGEAKKILANPSEDYTKELIQLFNV